ISLCFVDSLIFSFINRQNFGIFIYQQFKIILQNIDNEFFVQILHNKMFRKSIAFKLEIKQFAAEFRSKNNTMIFGAKFFQNQNSTEIFPVNLNLCFINIIYFSIRKEGIFHFTFAEMHLPQPFRSL